MVKQDGTYIDIEDEQILINIFEKNGLFHKESYEIEVYMYEDASSTKLSKKLKFLPVQPQVLDDMLVDEDENIYREETVDNPEEYVENYLSIFVDSEISNEDICQGTKELRSKEIFLDIEVECPDREELQLKQATINLYGSRAVPEKC